jgi:hypothetical protein
MKKAMPAFAAVLVSILLVTPTVSQAASLGVTVATGG